MLLKLLIHGVSESQGFFHVLHVEATNVDAAIRAAEELTVADGLRMDGIERDEIEERTIDEIPDGMVLSEPRRLPSGTVIAASGRIWHPLDE